MKIQKKRQKKDTTGYYRYMRIKLNADGTGTGTKKGIFERNFLEYVCILSTQLKNYHYLSLYYRRRNNTNRKG